MKERNPRQRTDQGVGSSRNLKELPWSWCLHLATVWVIAIAQPLFDILGRNAVFFVSHRLSAIEIVIFALILTVAPPTTFFLVELLAYNLRPKLGRALHTILVATILTLSVLIVAKTVLHLSPELWMAIFSMSALLIGFIHSNSRAFRLLLSVLSPAAPLSVLFFLLFSPASTLVLPGEDAGSVQATARNRTPVIFIVFDELPVASIMSSSGEVDAERLPNFGRLQEASTWYRNATAVHSGTRVSVPSLLSGVRGTSNIPTAGEYPRNIFQLLRSTHKIDAHEQITHLCVGKCQDAEGPANAGSVLALADDIAVVYSHIISPNNWNEYLPAIDESWSHFRRDDGRSYLEGGADGISAPELSRGVFDEEAKSATRQGQEPRVARFLQGFQSVRQPGLHYLHLMLPHGPYRYMPSGKQYDWEPNVGMDANERQTWGDNEYLVSAMQQRHLLQLSFADALLGQVLDALEAQRLFEPSLVVVAADHGASFETGLPKRLLVRENAASLMSVPLFIKYPGATDSQGEIDDRNVELVDVLPTVADVLDADGGWEFDGVSLLSEGPLRGDLKTPRWRGEEVRLPGDLLSEVMDVVERRVHRFGDASDPYGLLRLGLYGSSLGQRIQDISPLQNSEVSAELVNGESRKILSADVDLWPNHIRGSIRFVSRPDEPLHVAVGVNGVIAGVGQTYDSDATSAKFSIVASDEAFVVGENVVRLFVVEGEPRAPELREVELS